MKCYFIHLDSNASNAQSEYILHNKTVYEARSLFMHAHGLPSVASYMARYVDNSNNIFWRPILKHFS